VFFSHTKSTSTTSHQPATSTFLLKQISTSYQPDLAEQSDNEIQGTTSKRLQNITSNEKVAV
jgi:hypothetical protein